MLKKSRFYMSAMLGALVLASLLITSNVRACEEEPQSLLTLFMNSDLVVLAKYESNGEGVKVSEDEYGYSMEAPRNLTISKIFKGQGDLKRVSFMFSEYVSTQQPTEGETPTEEIESHGGEEYFDVSKIKIGEEYLFFLKKNEETAQYNITDYMGGAKKLGKDAAVYEKSLTELADIAATPENQTARLTEWIVKSIEEPVTREDGIRDLSESFYNLNNPEQAELYKDKGPFVVNEGYGVYTVGVAGKLTATQASRISAVLYPTLQEAWFAEEPRYANYAVGQILGGFNKSRLANYAYSSLQGVDKNDTERRNVIIEFLTSAIDDQEFSQIYYDLLETENKIKEAGTPETPEAQKQMKLMIESKDTMLKNFDKRFKVLHGRNFIKEETAQVEDK